MASPHSPSRIGPYPIERELGRGGMGVVYLARDPRLERPVAIKVLPEGFALDPERLARFEREARILASLNHPNIAGIYGIEESDGLRFLALQYVEGETLAQRLARGRLPLHEGLDICRQIAAAVEAAHESGVIHRDLKPGNVKITPSNEVKVLDFGLAKGGPAVAASGSDPDLSHSPTLTYAATGVGVILGTAAYMSPEQARGKVVDKRTDIWSFGCILFESLTGEQLFAGETISDTIAKILEREPDWRALPAATPQGVRHLLQRCLEKDAKKRLRDIGDARLELEEVVAGRASAVAAAREVQPSGRSRTHLAVAWGLAGALALSTLALGTFLLWRKPVAVRPVRFAVVAPEGTTMASDAANLALSPDGRLVTFVAVDSAGDPSLWLRPLESLTARKLEGTEDAQIPFWSPDSRFIAFFAGGKLKKIAAVGGATEMLCDANNGRGGAWNREGVIVIAPAGEGPLIRVSEDGGETSPATALDSTRHETGHRFPCFLPDGRHFLFVALPGRAGKLDVCVGALGSSRRRLLMSAQGSPVYAHPGRLIYLRNGMLVAQRFDSRGPGLIGQPIPLGEASGGSSFTGAPTVSASTAGDLAYQSGAQENTQMVWMDRTGRRVGTIPLAPGRYDGGAPSPDGRWAAVQRTSSPSSADLWLVEVARGVATRFTFGPSINASPVWSPDSRRVLFESDREGTWDLYVKSIGGGTPEEAIFKSRVIFKHPTQWSFDGRYVVCEVLEAKTGWDLWVVPMEGDHTPRPLLTTPFNERFGAISPDGRWMCYTSDESGKSEVYVQSFPTPGVKHQISTGGGFGGGWREDGKELLYGAPDGRTAMAVEIQTGDEFEVGVPHALFQIPPTIVGTPGFTPDFQRLLMSVPAGREAPKSINLVLNWPAGLRRR